MAAAPSGDGAPEAGRAAPCMSWPLPRSAPDQGRAGSCDARGGVRADFSTRAAASGAARGGERAELGARPAAGVNAVARPAALAPDELRGRGAAAGDGAGAPVVLAWMARPRPRSNLLTAPRASPRPARRPRTRLTARGIQGAPRGGSDSGSQEAVCVEDTGGATRCCRRSLSLSSVRCGQEAAAGGQEAAAGAPLCHDRGTQGLSASLHADKRGA